MLFFNFYKEQQIHCRTLARNFFECLLFETWSNIWLHGCRRRWRPQQTNQPSKRSLTILINTLAHSSSFCIGACYEVKSRLAWGFLRHRARDTWNTPSTQSRVETESLRKFFDVHSLEWISTICQRWFQLCKTKGIVIELSTERHLSLWRSSVESNYFLIKYAVSSARYNS